MKIRSLPLRLAPLVAAVVACSAFAALPANAQHEISTARIHATVATQIDSLTGVHLHLHHVINCLVGTHGKGYDAAAAAVSGYPCKGLGNGAVDDSRSDPAAQHAVKAALLAAQAGVKSTSVDAGHADAHKVLAALDQADPAAATAAH